MEDLKETQKRVWAKVEELRKQGKLPEWTLADLLNEPTALANSKYRLESTTLDPGGFLGPSKLDQLVGRTFMYRSKYGLHEWTDKVSEVPMHKSMQAQPGKLFDVMSYTVEFYVRATRTDHIYPLKDVIFLD